MVGGDERVTRFRDETMNEDYDVQVRLKEGDRNEAEPIARLFVPRQGGGLGAPGQRREAGADANRLPN